MKKISKSKKEKRYAYQWLNKYGAVLILLLAVWNEVIYCIIFGTMFFFEDVAQADIEANIMEVVEKTLGLSLMANLITFWLETHIISWIYDRSFEKRFKPEEDDDE